MVIRRANLNTNFTRFTAPLPTAIPPVLSTPNIQEESNATHTVSSLIRRNQSTVTSRVSSVPAKRGSNTRPNVTHYAEDRKKSRIQGFLPGVRGLALDIRKEEKIAIIARPRRTSRRQTNQYPKGIKRRSHRKQPHTAQP